MIDTVKIAIYRDFNRSIYDSLLNNSEQKKNGFFINNRTGILETTEVWRMVSRQYEKHEQLIINGKMKAPSFNYHINWRCYEDRVEIEFSIPKFIYGTNCLELLPHIMRKAIDPYQMLIRSIKKFMNYYFFGHKIDYGGIQLLRWDLCFNQVFDSREQSLKALEYIKIKNSKEKDTKNYKTGFVELTSSKYFKIYHKGTEYETNDKEKIEKYKDQFGRMAEKILRYERKITPKSIAYWYNTKWKYRDNFGVVHDYLQYKKKWIEVNGKKEKNLKFGRKIPTWLRNEMESIPKFTLGTPTVKTVQINGRVQTIKMSGFVKMEEFVFNHLYTMFRDDIKKRFTIGGVAVDRLQHEVINEENPKYKRQKVKILALIKVYGSIEKAIKKGVISDTTGWRYKKIMEEKNLSTTRIKSEIKQDWTHENYFREILRNSINVNFLTNDIRF